MQTLRGILKSFPHSDFLAPVRISISTPGTPFYESLTLYSRCERFGRNCGLSCSTIHMSLVVVSIGLNSLRNHLMTISARFSLWSNAFHIFPSLKISLVLSSIF